MTTRGSRYRVHQGAVTTAVVALLAFAVGCKSEDEGGQSQPRGSKPASKPDQPFQDAKAAMARTEARNLVAAYQQWRMKSAKPCPADLRELLVYTNKRSAKDPWGRDYVVHCGASAPAKAGELGISSAGPDGKPGTADDVTSWD